MSNRLYQTIIHQMRDIVGRTIGVIDENGIVIACSDLGKIGESKQRIKEELTYSQDFIVYDGYTYRFVGAQEKTDSIAFVEGDDIHASKMSQLLSISLGNIKSLYDENTTRAPLSRISFLTTFSPATYT